MFASIIQTQEAGRRVLRAESTSAELIDLLWLNRDRLLSLSEGSTELVVSWQNPDGPPVEVSYCPRLPEALRLAR